MIAPVVQMEPDFQSGDVRLWLDAPTPIVQTPGRSVVLGDTDDWKTVLRYLVRTWDLEVEAEARGES